MDLNIDLKNINVGDLKEKLKAVDKKTLIKFGAGGGGPNFCFPGGPGGPWPFFIVFLKHSLNICMEISVKGLLLFMEAMTLKIISTLLVIRLLI